MGLENRWSERQAANVNVLISAPPHGLRQARIRDISASGLFVELPSSVSLADHALVELIFVRSENHIARLLRVPAEVVHTTGHGAGLMFRDFNLRLFHALLMQLLSDRHRLAQSSQPAPGRKDRDKLLRHSPTMIEMAIAVELHHTTEPGDARRLVRERKADRG